MSVAGKVAGIPEIVTTTGAQTLTSKTLTAPTITAPVITDAVFSGTTVDTTFLIVDNADATKKARFELSGVTTGTTRVVTLPDADITVASLSRTETLSSKTLVADSTKIADGTAPTKLAHFVASGITAGQDRAITLQNADGTMAYTSDVSAEATARDAAIAAIFKPVSVGIISPASPDLTNVKIPLFRAARAAVISNIISTIVGSTSVTWILKEGADLSAAGTAITASQVTTNTTTGQAASPSVDGYALTAGHIVWLLITAMSGTPASFTVSFDTTGG